MTLDEAACIEPISVAYRGCVKAGISTDSNVLIAGCGEQVKILDFKKEKN